MSTETTAWRKRMRTHVVGARRGTESAFTLIEILVVVAIVALLITILLPALARARAHGRMTVCASHLRELGHAMEMYTNAHNRMLPGPQHPAMLTDIRGYGGAHTVIEQFYLPKMLRRYFSEAKEGSGLNTDEIATCPDFPIRDEEFYKAAPYRPFHYVINTWTYTEPQYYFGFIWASFPTYEDWVKKFGDSLETYGPKKVNKVKKASQEWAIADAFQKPDPDERPDLVGLGHGSWPREDYKGADSGLPLPKAPFHLYTGYEREGAVHVYRGRTNTLYFDWHVASQKGWRGTVNPVGVAGFR